MTYPKASAGAAEAKLTASPDFPRIEEEVLAYWKTDGTFQASIDNRPAGADGENEFVFYDGPPFANGLPHYGHLLTGYVKDVIPRYQTHARAPGGAPVRVGHATGCRPSWRPSGCSG